MGYINNKIIKNYIYNLVGQLLTIVIPVVTAPYISRVLGPQAIGDFGYTTGIVSYFCIFAMLGTANYAQREIAKNHESRNEVSRLFFEILIIRIIMILIVLAVYIAFINLPMWNEYHVLFFVQVVSFVSWGTDISWFWQGLEQFKITAIRNSVVKMFSAILIFLVVKRESDLILYTFIYCISDLIGNMTMWPHLKENIIKIDVKRLSILRHMRGIWELFIPNIAMQVYAIFDKTMLGSMVNTLQVGYYSQAEKIIKIVLVVISSLFTVLLPRFAYLGNKRNGEEANVYFTAAVEYTYFLSIPMTIGCICVSTYFVPIFFGEGYEIVAPLMKILSLLFVVMSLERLMGTVLIAYNKQNIYAKSVILAAIVNVLLNAFFICIMRLDAIGVAISSVVAELVALIVQLWNLPKEFQKKYVIKSIKNYLIAGIGMLLILIGLNRLIVGQFLHLIIDVIVGCGAYFVVLFFMKDKMIKKILKLFRQKN